MESISNIIKIPDKKKTSERAELLKFFVENLKDRKGKQYKPHIIAVKLSHLSLKDLYAFRSQCNDRLMRNGYETFSKYFWWSIKAK